MQVTVPIYIQTSKTKTGIHYVAGPLFDNSCLAGPGRAKVRRKRGEELGRLLASLSGDLRRFATDAARDMTNEALFDLHQPEHLNWCFSKLTLDLKDSTAKLKLLLVSFSRSGLKIGFSPSIPDVWFEIRQSETLMQRAIEVYQEHFRKLKSEDPSFSPERYSVRGKAWLDSVELSIPRLSVRPPKSNEGLTTLFGLDVSDGAEQLTQVGRCLDALDVSDLADPQGIDEKVRELDIVLRMREPRSVVLVGPRGSGKTAMVQGWVRRRKLKESKPRIKNLVFELSASRLISGMSYLGQWESRVTGILEFSHRMNHILYFSDFLGLYRAGVTRNSKYSVADLIRGQKDRRPVRMIAELTEEAWTILRERDPGMANHFAVIHISALDEERSLPILLGVIRSLEMRNGCRFDLEALPEVVRLYDRFVRDSVLPGKAIDALRRLAIIKQKQDINVEDVWQEFHLRTGLAKRLIDRKQKLDRPGVEASLQGKLIGQPEAIRAMADRILVAAARMNENSRPLGVLLFLGPTGVGKTEAAKCMAEYLYGEGGLLRIDMNELSGPMAAATMLGTFDAPEGRLTGAVRQRPFCVVLLDEIEKAHPAVLDVLLQALGEARMTDPLGRTVDLSGTVIIMTSNLGADDARRRLGFAGGDAADKRVRLKAVRDFFRPEFVNRIDEIVHFGALSVEDVKKIASIQLEQVLRRDGLIRRRTILDVAPEVLDWTVQQGFDTTRGARAIKRALERFLVDLAAPKLVGLDVSTPHLVQVKPGAERPLEINVRALREVPQAKSHVRLSASDTLQLVKKELAEIEVRLPRSTTTIVAGSSQETVYEFALREVYRACVDKVYALKKLLEPRELTDPVALPSIKPVKRVFKGNGGMPHRFFTEMMAAEDLKAFLTDALTQTSLTELDQAAEAARCSLRRLKQALQCTDPFVPARIVLRSYGSSGLGSQLSPKRSHMVDDVSKWIETGLVRYLKNSVGLEVEVDRSEGIAQFAVSGVLSQPLVSEVLGSCLWIKPDGAMQLVEIKDGDTPPEDSTDIDLRYIGYGGGPLLDLSSGVAIDRFVEEQHQMPGVFERFWEVVGHVA